MENINAATLVNLLGFAVGIALYSLIIAMVWSERRSSSFRRVDILLFATGFLGLLWNVGELIVVFQRDFNQSADFWILTAASFAALGFLPSVVVHSVQNVEEKPHWLTYLSYSISTSAAALQLYAGWNGHPPPSELAMQILTFGSVLLALGLVLFNWKQTYQKKVLWMVALLVFAVSTLHLSGEQEGKSWIIELVSHQSSLTIALVILYQNYRFAFADLFLKRAISLILLTVVAFSLYIVVAAPLLSFHETHHRNDVFSISIVLVLWIATALVYSSIHKLAVWLVDKVILHRADYAKFQTSLAQKIERIETIEQILNEVSVEVATVLTAHDVVWSKSNDKYVNQSYEQVELLPDSARIIIPTAEAPFFQINLSDFYGGRRLLSDETTMLEVVSHSAARRIDGLRVMEERWQIEFREQEFSKLTAEARLTALRSQINPHFLFNALTTIGYLIQSAPEKAFETLLHLTKLLRSVLSSTAEFSSLGSELNLVETYLDIERARFEERLSISIDVPEILRKIDIPSFIVQQLVENAIKHGISENSKGGEVRITARIEKSDDTDFLCVTVFNTNAGRPKKFDEKHTGVGLANIRGRLKTYYADLGTFTIDFADSGTSATIRLPTKSA